MTDIHKKIYNFYVEGTQSIENYNSLDKLFFMRSPDNGSRDSFKQNLTAVNKIAEELKLPFQLKLLYQLIGDTTTELYVGEWTIINLEQLKERYNTFKKHDQTHMIDFAYKYMGMGHVKMCFMDPLNSKVGYRRDGGASSIEREYNFKRAVNMNINCNQSFENFMYDVLKK